MSSDARLASFALALALVFGASWYVGSQWGPSTDRSDRGSAEHNVHNTDEETAS